MADNDASKSRKPINIISGTLVDPIERSIQNVTAAINLNTNLIEVEFAGLGEGEVYIVDSSNKVVDYAPVVSGMSFLTLDVPLEDGNYYLIISCPQYYGEGYFTID